MAKKETKNKNPTPANRDKQGRFVKGKSGNPNGRPGLPEEIKEYGRDAPKRLRAIADDEYCPLKLKVEIEKWFAEMAYGKPRQQVDMDAQIDGAAPVNIQFTGELEEWSK